MVLDHVAGDADAVEVAGPAADADVLGHGDLDVVDVVVVPDRLEQLVGEPQRHQVLHRLLAQVVVDPEHRRRGEDAGDDPVQLPGAGQVVPERLLDHHPAPLTGAAPRPARARGAGRPRSGTARVGWTGRTRGCRRCRAPRPARAMVSGQIGERLVVPDLARDEPDSLRQLLPDLLAERRPGVLPHGVVHDLGEVLVLPLPAGEPDQGEAGRQQPAVGQVVDRRHQLLGGQIPGDAEDHQHARTGDPRQSSVLRIAERVGVNAPSISTTLSSLTGGVAP